MRMYKLFIIIALFTTFVGCNKKESSAEVKRPIDHWVFRSVLDWNPRMVTLALSDDLWASYHAETGALYKAWKGSVYFDGAVYTTAHGPQPISIGNSYVENMHKNPWYALSGKDTIPVKFDYKGHRFVKGKAQLMYQLSSEKWAKPVRIYEEIDVEKTDSGQSKFLRTFTTENVADGVNIGLMANLSSIVVENNIETDGKWTISKKEEVKIDNVTTLNVDGFLILNNNAVTKFHTTFTAPTIENKNVAGGKDDEVVNTEGSLPEGLQLIAKSDCKTCHNKTLQTIGPAYVAIAQKYKNTPENISLLSSKVKAGGSGVWGEQMMTPHADLAEEDINKMVSYIL